MSLWDLRDSWTTFWELPLSKFNSMKILTIYWMLITRSIKTHPCHQGTYSVFFHTHLISNPISPRFQDSLSFYFLSIISDYPIRWLDLYLFKISVAIIVCAVHLGCLMRVLVWGLLFIKMWLNYFIYFICCGCTLSLLVMDKTSDGSRTMIYFANGAHIRSKGCGP